MNLYDNVKKVWNDNEGAFEKRTADWAKNLKANSAIVRKNRLSFRAWQPFGVYLSYSLTKLGQFSIRYCGQETAKLRIRKGQKALRIGEENQRHNEKFFFLRDFTKGEYDWKGVRACEFRRHFKGISTEGNVLETGIQEHKLESEFLQEMSKRYGKNKFSGLLSHIQPVKIAGCPFQMPLPIKGSSGEPIKGDGHIDILARRRREDNYSKVVLSVWELKDFGKLAEAINQVYIYSITLLLMLKTHSGQAWYEIFGFKSKLPKKLEVDAVVAVHEKLEPKFRQEFESVKERMPLEIEEGTVRLYSCFYGPNPSLINFQRIA